MRFLLAIILYLTLQGVHCEKVRYDNYKLFKITPKNIQSVKYLQELEIASSPDFDFWNSVGPIGVPVSVMVPPNRVNDLENMAAEMGMDYRVAMDNVQEYIDLQEVPQPREEFGWTRYNTLEEINGWLRNLSGIYYPNVTLIEGGTSYQGRTIYGVKVSYSSDNLNNSVFIESNIHANEWITNAVVTYILNELLTSTNSTIRQVAERYDWYFFPVFNPDGYVYAHTENRLWRKTVVPHSILCFGADPNRNWNYFWNQGGTSASPCSHTYRGPQPFSEPSCRSLSQFITNLAPQLVAYLSFHSFSQMLLLPYGYTPEHLDNYYEMYELGVKAVEALSRRYGTQYVVGTTYEVIYPASGTSADWVKGTFQVPIVYTYELRDQGDYGFLLPPDQIIPTAEETLDSFITIFVEYANSNNETLDI